MTAPTAADGRCRITCQTNDPRRGMRSSGTAFGSSRIRSLMPTPSSARAAMPPRRASRLRGQTGRVACSCADPGVEPEVDEVGDEVEEHDRDREHEERALEHGIVAREHRFVDAAADPGPGED